MSCGWVFVLLVGVALLGCAGAEGTDRPIIGILTQPMNATHSYIGASYVKYVESGGARAVPIHFDGSAGRTAELFNSVNGVLFPGGDAALSGPFLETARLLFNLTLRANERGVVFPLWGTCLGFELLHVCRAGSRDVLSHMNAHDVPMALHFTDAAAHSRLFADASPEVMVTLATRDTAYNNHEFGVVPKTYADWPAFADFFDVLSTNVDSGGVEFVSTVEAKQASIYGTQWHPEKNAFEWHVGSHFDHSTQGIRAMEHLSRFFVAQARRNSHAFDSDEAERRALIYETPVTFTDDYFLQSYYWPIRA